MFFGWRQWRSGLTAAAAVRFHLHLFLTGTVVSLIRARRRLTLVLPFSFCFLLLLLLGSRLWAPQAAQYCGENLLKLITAMVQSHRISEITLLFVLNIPSYNPMSIFTWAGGVGFTLRQFEGWRHVEVKFRKRRQTRRAEFWRTWVPFGRNGWACFGLGSCGQVCGHWGCSHDDRGRRPAENRAGGIIRGCRAEAEPLSTNSRIRAAQVKGAVGFPRVGSHNSDGCPLTFPIITDLGDEISVLARTTLPLWALCIDRLWLDRGQASQWVRTAAMWKIWHAGVIKGSWGCHRRWKNTVHLCGCTINSPIYISCSCVCYDLHFLFLMM